MKRLALLFVLVTVLPARGENTEFASRLDAFTRPYEEAGHLSGVLLVAEGDDILVERSYGMANYEWDIPNDADTRLAIASINKPITIIMCARMTERGDLDLAAPIATYLPGFPKADELHVIDLVNHTAGVPHRVTEPEEECVARTPADMVALVTDRGLDEAMIGQRSYSSAGYAVLARILEIAGGASYAELLEELVLRPAGATSTLHPEHRGLIPRRAECYYLRTDGLQNAQPKDLSFLVGGGALYSTARDLHRILRTLVTGGYGVTAQEYAIRGREEFSWNGSTSGYRAFVSYRVEDGRTVVFCSNIHSGAGYRLLDALDALLSGEEVVDKGPPRIEVATVPEEDLRALCGDYRMRPGTDLNVNTDGSVLYSNDWPLLPLGGRRFFSLQDYGPVEFVPGEGGAIERLDWYWTGSEEAMSMPRVDSPRSGLSRPGGQG